MSATELIALGYFSSIALAAALEALVPLRAPLPAQRRRWAVNIALALIDTAILRLLLPVTVVGVAVGAAGGAHAILPALGLSGWAAGVATFLLLDAAKFGQHLALHRFGWLWRFHAAHHADGDYDFTTGLRFHPVEALMTVGLDLLLIAALGGPVEAVLAYEISRTALSILAHANLRLPDAADRVLRLVLVTPNVHRIHHAVEFQSRDCNFATVFSWWDRLAGTWHALPVGRLAPLAIGLPVSAGQPPEGLLALLWHPFAGRAARPDG